MLIAVLAVLATYRLAYMVAREDGPVDVFARLRDRVGQATWVGRGLHCVLCVSFWLALPVLALPPIILTWLAVAGGVLLLHRWQEGE